jgi:hypothetical protein
MDFDGHRFNVGFVGYWFWIFGFWRIEVRCGFLGCLVFNLWVSWTRVKCGFRGLVILSLWILVDKGKLWVSYLAFVGNWLLVFAFLEANRLEPTSWKLHGFFFLHPNLFCIRVLIFFLDQIHSISRVFPL